MEEHYKEDWRSLDLKSSKFTRNLQYIFCSNLTSNPLSTENKPLISNFYVMVFEKNCRLLACGLYGNNAEL